jgi:hypothetical protein
MARNLSIAPIPSFGALIHIHSRQGDVASLTPTGGLLGRRSGRLVMNGEHDENRIHGRSGWIDQARSDGGRRRRGEFDGASRERR